jgi:hypothetical protein
MTDEDAKPKRGSWFSNYRDHWFGFIAIVVVQSIIQAWTDDSEDSAFPLRFLYALLGIIAATNCVALFLFIITWPFKKNFNIARYMNILVVFAFFIMTIEIIHLALDFVRGEK